MQKMSFYLYVFEIQSNTKIFYDKNDDSKLLISQFQRFMNSETSDSYYE